MLSVKKKIVLLICILSIVCIHAAAVATEADPWTQISPGANWGGRHIHQAVAFDNKMWILGGGAYGETKNDVWYSSDGVNWTQATAHAQWSPRVYHQAVVHDNKLWILGGYDRARSEKNDVWYSSDGINWTQVTADAPWSPRIGFRAVEYDNKIWVIGGISDVTGKAERHNDVWYSGDGISWVETTGNASWSPRGCGPVVVYTDTMWLLGGTDASGYRNDVWSSEDGYAWNQMTANASWSGRVGHQAAAFDNRIWVIGGYRYPEYTGDVWYSGDGVHWTPDTENASWSARSDHQVIIFDNRMWLLGGVDKTLSVKNDVWQKGVLVPEDILYTKGSAQVFGLLSQIISHLKTYVMGNGTVSPEGGIPVPGRGEPEDTIVPSIPVTTTPPAIAPVTPNLTETPSWERPKYEPGVVIVKYKRELSEEQFLRTASGLNAEIGAVVIDVGIDKSQLVDIPDTMSIESAISFYEKNPDVAFAQPNYYYYLQ